MSSSDSAVSIRGLGKSYTIAHNQVTHSTLAETLLHRMRHPMQAVQTETFWALKDLSFEIKRGEVVGIIGRNGAGKSTLLKILSRITEPTTGEVELRGRVGSLLEVGTGFHPELTGRENIYLNGQILGMRKKEIERQFDAIVDFSGCEQFLDTPVKRYSSGMYVRLAFAVAAHLSTEILVVDEVLAVGDVEFQKRCLGKMKDVATCGRTVLFVSHNMAAVKSLCSCGILLDKGVLAFRGTIEELVHAYARTSSHSETSQWFGAGELGDEDCSLLSVAVKDGRPGNAGEYSSKDDITITFDFLLKRELRDLCIGYDLLAEDGTTVLRSYHTDAAGENRLVPKVGMNRWTSVIPAGLLNAGRYSVAVRFSVHCVKWIIFSDALVSFDVLLEHSKSEYWTGLTRISRPGAISPVLNWSMAAVG